MIKAVDFAQQSTSFRSNQPEKDKKVDDVTRILPNTMKTRVRQGFQKTSSAFLDYPVKGLRGDINSDFYEFLTMGIVPYVLGSLGFMFVFNCANKSKFGNKMALGVLLYGIFKNLSKNLVTQPIKAATGIDTEMPYENIVYPLPKQAGEQANIDVQHQQRKVFDSKEFYRKDLLEQEYFDKIAKKLGLGENLSDSRTEVSPIIQNVIATSNMAKSLASYSWAAVGVGLAVQEPWSNFFDSVAKRDHYRPTLTDDYWGRMGGKILTFWSNVGHCSRVFAKSFTDSCKSLWKGNHDYKGFQRNSGKYLIGFATLATTLLTANSILRAKDLAKNNNLKTIDKTKESTVI